ncbi:putative ribonuclease H protein, partial [Trifolium medium]|nr:putative ribonuclease H protein [Trifolium medium]
MNGCRWRIGDGTKIKIMNEPWLKKENGLWMQSPLDQDVANNILAVPLFEDVEEDKLIWQDDSYGNYSVKSAYNMLLNPTVAAARTDMGDWKWLWKAQAPPKSKHLIW